MHPNEERTRDIYDAMSRGDGRALARYLTPQTRWIIAGSGPTAGAYTGPDEIFGFWKKTAEQTGGGLRLQLRDVLANDERAVALVDVSGHRHGRELKERQVVAIEWTDEVISSATFIYEDPRAYDEFWSD